MRLYTVIGVVVLPARETEMPAGTTEVTVYELIRPLPLSFGAVKWIVACPVPAVTVPMPGASGTSCTEGFTEFEDAEAGPFPSEFVAVTLNV